MKPNKIISTIVISTLTIGLLAFIGCKKDEKPTPDPNKTTYLLKVKDQLGINGTVTFTETSSTLTTITIDLNGGSAADHPAEIRMNSAIEGGITVLTLTPVNSSGNSTTQVSKLDDNTPVNYNQFINFNGYLSIHESAGNLGTIIAISDIGGNELTSTQHSYALDTANASGVKGTALFEKRKNGSALVTISLTGTIAGDVNPAQIRLGSVATIGGGPVKRTLTNVNGTSGKSYTNVRALDDGTPITYDNWLVYDGYITVHYSTTNTSIIAQGDIGSN